MKLKPVGDRVMAKRLEAKTKTDGGILLPDELKEKPNQAIVVAVGDGYLTDIGTVVPLEVKVGDKILFSKNSGTSITIDNEEYMIFEERELLGIIKS
jgi:chaperonin GroES